MPPTTPQNNPNPNPYDSRHQASTSYQPPAGQPQPNPSPYGRPGQSAPGYQQTVAGQHAQPNSNPAPYAQQQPNRATATPGYSTPQGQTASRVEGEEKLSRTTKKSIAKDPHNPLSTLRPGEKIICEIKRHPFSMIGTYFGAGTVMAVTLIVGYGLLPKMLEDYSTVKAYGIITLIVLCIAIIVGLFVWVALIIHKGNRWIVTSDSIVQVKQVSLFNKNNSQLSFNSLEDLTAEKNGILAHMLNFGTLRTQSAGEVSKFRFPYCPQPNHYATLILRAKEEYDEQQRQVHMAPQPYRQPPPQAGYGAPPMPPR